MGCFTVPGIIDALIWLVVICAIVGIIRVILPIVLGWLGVAGGVVEQVLRIILIATVIIIVLLLVLWLFGCTRGLHLGMLLSGVLT